MEYQIDIQRLRRDLIECYGTAMSNGFPMAVMDLSIVEQASDQDLVEIADRIGVDISQYCF